jgi:RND superfamily putative drug exporter
LFLISRYREELSKTADRSQALAHAMRGVGEALSASALTTIVGLGMMWFADFGKFRFSGPVIGLALLVALVTCLTLTPAILFGFSRILFWPGRVDLAPTGPQGNGGARRKPNRTRIERVWRWTADSIVRRPGRYLAGALVAMAPLAAIGMFAPRFTYDSLATLDPSQPSRAGADIMRRYFPVGESSPITVLISHPRADFSEPTDRFEIRELTTALYEIGDVQAVRSIIDPLGDLPPDGILGLVDRQAWRTLVSRPHRKTSRLFLGNQVTERTHAARVDVVVRPAPFSLEASEVVGKIESALAELSKDDSSFWRDTEFRLAGTTVGFRDLRQVTQSDTVRIRWLTVFAVYLVLVVITRRAGVSAYMIASVLLTYLVTLGAVWLLFSAVGGESFQGLDWRVPLFLFVILVAIGQDYNVYLAMRVFEEQKNFGPIRGVREAVAKTGGIITSCGLVMAGTFFSMTATAWSPWLGGLLGIPGWANQPGNLSSIVQLGAALSIGVLLDTFIVRSILLPSFLVLLCHLRRQRRRPPAT